MLRIISLIIGLMLSFLLGYVIKKRKCIVVDIEYIESLKNSNHKHKGKCYKYNPQEIECK